MIATDVPQHRLKGVNHALAKQLNRVGVPKCQNGAELEDIGHRGIVNRFVLGLLSVDR